MYGRLERHFEWPIDYHWVATVEAEDVDEVFRLTNDDAWDRPEVTRHVKCHRDTSVGDVVVGPDGRPFLCLVSGWMLIG
jgi:hypothetical protein